MPRGEEGPVSIQLRPQTPLETQPLPPPPPQLISPAAAIQVLSVTPTAVSGIGGEMPIAQHREMVQLRQDQPPPLGGTR